MERDVVSLINGIRTDHGLRPLRVVGGLSRSARAHSTEMLAHGYFAHDSMQSGVAWDARVRHYCARRVIGENLAWGTGTLGTAASALRAWLTSPPHRAILLDAGFASVGVGIATGRFAGNGDATLFTADFASAR